MAATVRGGPKTAKPRPKAAGSAKAPAKTPAKGCGKTSGYIPAKLGPAHGVGLPPRLALAIAGGAVVIALIGAMAAEHRAQRVAGGVNGAFEGLLGHMGLRVESLTVQGATPEAQADIVKAAQVFKDQPILGLDLDALRQRVEHVGWVKSARVVRLLPDSLVIAVDQRPILAVWQHGGSSTVIDETGQAIPEADPSHFSDLPLVVGDGAAEAASAILPLVRARPRLMQRLDALVRVDDRRWDLRMADGSLIQLPAEAPDSALIQLDQLDQKSRILELGFARIDLRDPDMVTVRPKDAVPPGQVPSGGA